MRIPNKSFLSIFSKIKDPRVDNDNKKHLLIDILAITLCGVICKFETWEEIADYGEEKKEWFSSFLELPNGIPSHDTFRRVFMLLDPKEFNRCFIEWTRLIQKKLSGKVVAIDGKTVGGSANENQGKRAVHMVSAWATDNGVVLSQLQIDDKSNEITAIPEVLKSLDIKGAIVTIDAMGCQTDIASQIITQKGDYVLALKKNHKGLYERIEEAFKRAFEVDFKNINYSYHQTIDENHGRYEERNYFKIDDMDFLKRTKEWKGLSAIGLVESIVTRSGKASVEKRYYITSLKGNADEFGSATRKHWGVENNLHWVLDVQFNDDNNYKRSKNSAANFSMVKRVALNLLKQESSPWKTKKKRMKALFDDKFLGKVLGAACC